MTEESVAFDIIEVLCSKGCKAHLTGGAVRDLFLGIDPKDYDIVTDATVEQLHLWFSDRHINTVGSSFEVTIIDGVDVAGYRVDVYNNNELSHVEPAMTIEADLSRRDITINSFAFCPYTNELIDPFNGKDDLENKIIRFTGDPYKRIAEDPCRIIRACRFFAKIGKGAEFAESTFKALCDCVDKVKTIAPERIRKEIMVAMSYDAPYLFFDALLAIGALQHILPSLYDCIGVEGGEYHTETVFQHLLLCGSHIPKNRPLLRLAGYLHDVGKAASMTVGEDGAVHFIDHENIGAELVERDLKALKFSNEELSYVLGLVKEHMKPVLKIKSKKSFRKLYRSFLENNVDWKDFILLRIADRKANLAKSPHTREEIKSMVLSIYRIIKEPKRAFCVKDLAISGFDIMKVCNIKPGPTIKQLQNVLLDVVLEEPANNEHSFLIKWLENYWNEVQNAT